MVRFKKVTSVTVSLMLIVVSVVSIIVTHTQNVGGRYSGVYNLTLEEKEWIIQNFGDCEDIEQLMLSTIEFARREFVYDKEKTVILQHFVFSDTVNTGKGICFDFSCFFKSVCLTWAEHTKTSLNVFVVDVMTTFSAPRHSYSVVEMSNGTNYFLDLTTEIALKAKGKPAQGFDTFYEDIKSYAAKYKEIVINTH